MGADQGTSAALGSWLCQRRWPHDDAARRLQEELVSFLARAGLQVDEVGGVRVATEPVDSIDEALAWRFVADHLISRGAAPVATLCRMARLFALALRDAGRRGLLGREQARNTCRTALLAAGELPRLDGAARALRDLLGEGRPGKELWEEDRDEYARAMQRWQSQLPLAQEELEGHFVVESIDAAAVHLVHRSREEAIELELPSPVLERLQMGDRLDLHLGRGRWGDWFVIDAYCVAAPNIGPRGSTAAGSSRTLTP